MTRRNLTISMLLLVAAGVAVMAAVRWTDGSSGGDTFSGGHSGSFADLMLAPEVIAFGDVPIGELAHRSVIATNLGTDVMEFEQVRTVEPFRVAGSGFILGPGESREISVGFGNREAGEFADGSLELVSRELGTARVPLSAMVEVPQQVLVEPATLEFGEVAVGQIASAMLTISNPGNRPLRISGLGAITPFSSGSYPPVIGPGESVAVEVFYRPEEIGKARGSFRIRSDDPAWPNFSISLKGVGMPEEPNPRMIASNSAIEFGSVSVGDVRTKWLAVTNRGYSPLTIRSITAEKPFSGPKKGRTLKSGGVYRFPVTFSPADEGARLTAMMIHSNDPDAEPLIISLVGEGIGPGTTDFASQPTGFPEDHATRGEDSPYSDLPPWAWDGPGNDPGDPNSKTALSEELAAGDSLWVSEDSKVAIGARTATMGDYTFRSLEWDGENLVLEGVQLPTIEMPFGDSFSFHEIEGPISSTWVDGELVLEFIVTVENGAGDAVQVAIKATTGPTERVGDREARSGSHDDPCLIQMVAQSEIEAQKQWEDMVIAFDMSFQTACN